MKLTLSLDEETVARARRSAEALGKSLDQLVREYLEQHGAKPIASRMRPRSGVCLWMPRVDPAAGSLTGTRFTSGERRVFFGSNVLVSVD